MFGRYIKAMTTTTMMLLVSSSSSSLLLHQSWRSDVIGRSVILSVCLSVCLSVSRITHDRGNGRRPNMVGMGKG